MSIELDCDSVVHVAPPVFPVTRAAIPNPSTAVIPVVGPSGPPGPSGSASGGYVRHEQSTPASVVTIVHNLGRWPGSVMLASLDGSITFDEFGLQFLDLNTIRISIDTPSAYVALIV